MWSPPSGALGSDGLYFASKKMFPVFFWMSPVSGAGRDRLLVPAGSLSDHFSLDKASSGLREQKDASTLLHARGKRWGYGVVWGPLFACI